MDNNNDELRQQLLQAIASVQRQIDVDATPTPAGVRYGGSQGMRSAIDALQTELVQLQEALHNLDAGAPDGGASDPSVDDWMAAEEAEGRRFEETRSAVPDDHGAWWSHTGGKAIRAISVIGIVWAIAMAAVRTAFLAGQSQWAEVRTDWILAAILVAALIGLLWASNHYLRRLRGSTGRARPNQPDIVS